MAPLQGPTGERNDFSYNNEHYLGAAISSTTRKADDVARLFELFYSREGQLLMNMGVEGDTYRMVNGVPTFTDKVLRHPTLSVSTYLQAYVSQNSYNPTVIMPEMYLATLTPAALEGNRITSAAIMRKKLPELRFTASEAAEISALEMDINTYAGENQARFINGEQPFSQWNAFQQGFQQLRLSRLLELYSAAYQRFLAASR